MDFREFYQDSGNFDSKFLALRVSSEDSSNQLIGMRCKNYHACKAFQYVYVCVYVANHMSSNLMEARLEDMVGKILVLTSIRGHTV